MTIDPNPVLHDGGDPDPLARVGDVIDGRYTLLEFIGQGGMGNVYRAEHKTIRKPVALKLLHPSLANVPEIRGRFEREAFAIGRIDHPNCVAVSDFGDLSDGSLFLVMEYLDGESVADLLERRGALDPTTALHVTRWLLAGLAHAHSVGIVHRDVKPENIHIVEVDNDPLFAKLLDFGIAKVLDPPDEPSGREKLTQAGITFGTPTYISPEQALGDPADARSDIYSTTVVLYELLTGRPPFISEDKVELLAMHANRKPPKLSESLPGREFSAELEAMIQRGMAKRRADRYQDATEYIIAIDDLIGPLPRAGSQAEGVPSTNRTSAMLTPLPSSARVVSGPTRPISEHDLRPKGSWVGKVVTLLILAVVLGGVVFLFSTRTDVVGKLSGQEMSAVARQADKQLQEGDPERAIELIQTDDKSAIDPTAQLKLGHALAAKAEYSEALEAYDNALKLDKNVIRDPDLIRNLDLMVDGSGPVYVEALRMQIIYGESESARERLVELASGRAPKTRAAAQKLAETLGLDDRIDKVQAAIWDLRQGRTCRKRARAIPRLRLLGDKRAIEALKALISTRRLRRHNRCMRAAARDAIKYLEGLPD